MRDIRRLIEREPEYINEYRKSTYTDKHGREKPFYYISKKGVARLNNRYRYRAVTSSLEKSFEEWLSILFPNEKIIRQYKVHNYRIDFYMPELGICIEYDEKEHNYKKEYDEKRQREIQEWLKEDYLENIEYDQVVLGREASVSFPFLRVREGKEIEAIRELLFLIRKQTMSDVLTYMS